MRSSINVESKFFFYAGFQIPHTETNCCRAWQIYCWAIRCQAQCRHRAAQPLEKDECKNRHPVGDYTQQHFNDWRDGCWQNWNCTAVGKDCRCALCEGRGIQVHRSWLRRPWCRKHGTRPDGTIGKHGEGTQERGSQGKGRACGGRNHSGRFDPTAQGHLHEAGQHRHQRVAYGRRGTEWAHTQCFSWENKKWRTRKPEDWREHQAERTGQCGDDRGRNDGWGIHDELAGDAQRHDAQETQETKSERERGKKDLVGRRSLPTHRHGRSEGRGYPESRGCWNYFHWRDWQDCFQRRHQRRKWPRCEPRRCTTGLTADCRGQHGQHQVRCC